MSNRKVYSPYSESAVAFVNDHPGCTKADLARHLKTGRIHFSKLYYLVNTQIRIGNIKAHITRSGHYQLFVK